MRLCPNNHYYDQSAHKDCPHCIGGNPGKTALTMRLCPNNHYYDQSIYNTCPYCISITDPGRTDPGGTVPVPEPYNSGIGATVPVAPPPGNQPRGGGQAVVGQNGSSTNYGKTMPVGHKIGIKPVVGWLVCIEGKNKGCDYRICAEDNSIGRIPSMNIAIVDDETVSRENHATIFYEAQENAFYFAQGRGASSMVRVNGKPTLSTIQLAAYDQIEIGETKLVFVPLCGEDFDWIPKEKQS